MQVRSGSLGVVKVSLLAGIVKPGAPVKSRSGGGATVEVEKQESQKPGREILEGFSELSSCG